MEGVSSLVVQRLLCHTILEPPSSGIAVSWGLFFSSPALKNLVWSNPRVVIGYVDSKNFFLTLAPPHVIRTDLQKACVKGRPVVNRSSGVL